MMAWIEDWKQTVREMPWFAAIVALLVLLGVGVNAEVFGTADGDHARLYVGRVDAPAFPGLVAGAQKVHRCKMGNVPGVTVVLGLHRYLMEVTVPASVVRSRVAGVRTNLVCVEPALQKVIGVVTHQCRG